MHPLLQRRKVAVPTLLLPKKQFNPAVEGRRFHTRAVSGRPGQAIRRQIQVHVAIGDRPSLAETAADGAQFQLDVAPPLRLPVLHQGRIGVGPFRDSLVAGRAGALKKCALFHVFRATPQAHLVEEVPKGYRQQLRQPRRCGQIEATGIGLPGEAYQPMAELVGAPFGAVGGVEARHHPIQAEVPKFHLWQLPIAPSAGSLQIGAALWLPMGRQLQAMKVFEVGEIQTRTLGQPAHGSSGKRSTQLGDWCFHAAFL